ncbi:MAG: acylneuraminate cytidylyltransferase, partial [Anaerolineaceae bacterium]|nr:acylneuraminate cytidylyltransferase [Anaerolineaceae bacterium]
IAYSSAAAQQARHVTRIIVSTDDEEIAAIARQFGAETPFIRPPEFAQDSSQDLPVFHHTLSWLAQVEGYQPQIIVQLRPTSPLRPPGLVDEAIENLLEHPNADSVRGVVPAGQNPHKMWRIDPQSGQMKALLEVQGIAEPYNAPRQILPPVYWQTGHIDAIRPGVILEKNSMSGDVILPVLIDPRYTVDIDTPFDWLRYEWLAVHSGLDFVNPGGKRRPFPEDVRLLVLDFDGVLTDNRVWVDQDGRESVASSRGDGMGLRLLRETGVDVIVISTEVNPVVQARCRKLNIPAITGVWEKGGVLQDYMKEHDISSQNVVFLGNDINDLACFSVAGYGVAVADAVPEVLRQADLILTRNGGYGAVRELCDRILLRKKQRLEGARNA